MMDTDAQAAPLPGGPAPASDAATEKALRRQRKDRITKRILAILIVPMVIFSVRAWRIYAGVAACEQLFPTVDQQMHDGQWDDALATCDRCIALNPLYYPAYEAKASIYLDEKKDKEKALATLLEGVRVCHEDARMHRLLGQFHLESLHEYEKAQAHLRVACELDPSDLFARALLKRADAQVAKRS